MFSTFLYSNSLHLNSTFLLHKLFILAGDTISITVKNEIPKSNRRCYVLRAYSSLTSHSQYTLNVRSRRKQLVLFSLESWCLPRSTSSRKTNWFPEGPNIKCFAIFLDFHFNSNKRITGANQNSRLGTYNNTNLILKTTEWMIYKVLSLYYQRLFPSLAAVSGQCKMQTADCRLQTRGKMQTVREMQAGVKCRPSINCSRGRV